MGMSSSQARLLNLTARMHQIEYKAAKLEAQKLQMANESTRVYEEYLNAIDASKIQHKSLTSDGSVTYSDTTYGDLCLGGISFDASSNSAFLGNSVSSDDKVAYQYALFSAENGFMYVPANIKAVYEVSSDASDFASRLSGYIPPATPTLVEQPTDPVVVPDSENIIEGEDITLLRGNSTTIKAGAEPVTITLKNTFNGGDYKYTISSSDSDETVNLRYLENGRFVINGNNLTITESQAGQNDDLIIQGSHNDINAGGGNNIIRVGLTADSNGLNSQSNSNIVTSGSGNDYIQVFGLNNVVNSGSGSDTLYDISNNSTQNNDGAVTSYSNDNKISWIRQQYFGDCQTLSLINSIVNKGNYSQYFNIQGNESSGWNVAFKKSNSSIHVNQSDLQYTVNNEVAAAKGDKDIAILEAAFRKIIAPEGYSISDSDPNSTGSSANWHIVAKYILGEDKATYANITESAIKAAFNAYQNGSLSHLVVGTVQDQSADNEILGIYAQHAYSVTNVTNDTVTVVNPHDTKDHITLTMDDFLKYFKTIILFGKDYGEISTIISGSELNISNSENNEELYFGDTITSAQKYNLFINMYNAIEEAGGCVVVPDDMIYNKSYLTNIISDGAAYLKTLHNGKWIDTSVSTDTSLQEVQDVALLKKSEAKYEADMKRIDLKDRKYDTDLAALETERNAIKQEIDTLKTVAKDNVERTFKLFS